MPAATMPLPGPRVAASLRSAVLLGNGEVEIRGAPFPALRPREVLVRLEGCGVCASNIPIWEGRPWFRYPLPAGEPGHEGWGWIEDVGKGVTGFEPGDRITFLSNRSFATHEAVPVNRIVKLPPSLAGRPLPGEPLGCAMNILRRSRISAGQRVAVIGAGFLGTLLINLACLAGARVLAISRRPYSLAMAHRFGSSEEFDMSDPASVLERVQASTKGRLCDRVIEATGKQEGLDLASQIIRERGRLIIAGYHQDGARQVQMQLWNWRGIDVINAHERAPETYLRGMREAVQALSTGLLEPWPLFTHYLPLDRLEEAMRMTRDRPPGFVKALMIANPAET